MVVPDTGRFSLDIDLAEASVSGAVVDGEAGAPLPGVLLRLSAREDGRPGAGARSGPDGRFDMAAEPGEYVLSAELPGRVRLVLPMTVGPEGLADVRLEMDRGLAISGRLLGADGRPAAGQAVVAIGADGFERSTTRADGSFRLEGLTDRPYALSAGSGLAGFATRSGVRPGPAAVDLALQPAGKVELRVVSPDGQPVAGAFASVAFVDGAPLQLGGTVAPPTGSEGSTEVAVPAGEVGIMVSADSGAAFGTVVARSGETVPLVVVLQPGPAPTP